MSSTATLSEHTSKRPRLALWLGVAAALAGPVIGLIMGSLRLFVDESGEEVVNLGAIGVVLAVLLAAAGLALALRQRRLGDRTGVTRAALWLNAVVLVWWVVLAVADLVVALVGAD